MQFENTTHDIKITAVAIYESDVSKPEKMEYIWSYTIKIENLSSNIYQLVSRYWNIIDSNGCIKEVYGAGVVGQQPILEPNDSFEYTSQAVIHTSSGMMVGNYEMLNCDTGESVVAIIPSFALESSDRTTWLN
ncbi:MAG: Co2+/Mg2+ efflux protein ApaG [Sphingobacteriia bacterium]|nr:Co2+/Mg2+ efflux protein ApaG [Sphingobacteriia bacterium]